MPKGLKRQVSNKIGCLLVQIGEPEVPLIICTITNKYLDEYITRIYINPGNYSNRISFEIFFCCIFLDQYAIKNVIESYFDGNCFDVKVSDNSKQWRR